MNFADIKSPEHIFYSIFVADSQHDKIMIHGRISLRIAVQ